MAKAKKDSNDFASLLNKIQGIVPSANIVSKDDTFKINNWVSMGNYLLNAQISGSIYRGLPEGRVLLLAGDPGCLHPDQEIEVYIANDKDKKELINLDDDPKITRIQDLTRLNKGKGVYDGLKSRVYNSIVPGNGNQGMIFNQETFNIFLSKELTKIKIKDLIEVYKDKLIFINSFDGFQPIVEFYQKSKRDIWEVSTEIGTLKCSLDHMIETKEYGWKKVSELKVGDIALTEKGELPLTKCEKVDESIVYDFEVDHENHRYFCEGFSNHNTGKTFLSMNAAREAQREHGTKIFWFDSEGAMDNDTLERIGVDTSNVVIIPVETIRQTSQVMLNILDSISGEKSCEYMFVLDSLGNLSSDKETEDLLSGNNKRDMTKQQELKALFRTLLTRLRVKRVPMIVTSHVYEAIGSYVPTKIISGGSGAKFGASISLMLTTRQLKKEDDKDIDSKKVDSEIKKTGVLIKCKQEKARFTKAGIPITIHVSFYKGMNKYVGLQDYLDWEHCKVAPGKLVDEMEEYETGTGTIRRRKTGNVVFEPHSSEQAPRNWVIGDEQIPTKEFWRHTKTIFTPENLDYIDSKLQEVFMFAEYDEVEEIIAEELENESHLKETVVSDNTEKDDNTLDVESEEDETSDE